MSDITPKNYSGLMEAYASIYNQPEQIIQEQVEEEICFEDLEVDNDLMVDLVVDRLIVEGYANTEDEALNIIPHMSDAWLDTVIGNFVLEQNFIDTVNSIIEEGYDLSSYTVDELYGEYIGHFNQCVNEQYGLSLQEAIPLVAAPLAGPAIAAGLTGLVGGAAKLYQSMQRKGTDPASQRWLETGSYASTKQTPKQQRDSAAQRRQKAAERLKTKQQQQPAAQPTKPPAPAQPAAGGTPAAGPTPPKPPKGPNFLQRLGQAFKQSTSQRSAQKPAGTSGPSPRMQKATDILTHPFTKGAAATFTGTSAIGDLRGGGQGIRALTSLPVGAIGGGTKAIGYLSGSEGIKQTGRDIEKLGSVIKGGEEKKPKEEKPKAQKPAESLPGFE
jgi:hypothetical protein